MLAPIYHKAFSKDVKRCVKRGKDLDKLKQIIEWLLDDQALPKSCRDHKLVGNYAGRRECHIEPDWLLIYKKAKQAIEFQRTGSHADLFNN